MEIVVRLLLITIKLLTLWAKWLSLLWTRLCPTPPSSRLPAIENRLLTLSVQELRGKLRARQLTSVELVNAYVERIKAVNPLLNALIEERFEAALREAAAADKLIAGADNEALQQLFEQQPLLGLPFTVKETCALADMSFSLGSLQRRQQRAEADGVVVARLRAAGAIPLLVSSTPEYCYSIDTNTLLNGRTTNPYELTCTPGGSSGGEGALNGAGASLFGLGSDIGGSIRIPSLFCGIFGHKPTGGVVSVEGHFPSDADDEDFPQYLVLGPMTRFATDLAELLRIMAGEQAAQLRLDTPVPLQQLKVYYALGFPGLNGCMHQGVDGDMQNCIRKALVHLKSTGLDVQQANLASFRNSLEIAVSGIARLGGMQYLMPQAGTGATLAQLLRSCCGQSDYTRDALIFELMRRANAFMPAHKLQQYRAEGQRLAQELSHLLGDTGVLLFPTSHTPAFRPAWTPAHLWGVDHTLLFNVLGLPVTHVPMGLNAQGLPIGFSVIGAPLQDRLCLRLAVELERAFGGWQPPTPHKLDN
ncbi:hypothetical protein KR222_005323 [Zaprionus bogoriensis]|nr:hypothetical protein KR222_005323 [Zaprionus bogoriensis]